MKRMMFREAIASALAEEMRCDDKILVMGEDVAITGGVYKATKGLLEEFGPARVRNTPLSEWAIVGVATGAAMCGARPVAEIMHIDFVGCGFDIMLNQMSKMCYKTNGQVNVPMVLRTQGDRSKSNGCTQSQSLEALFTHIPGLKVVMPSTPYDAKGLLKTAIRDNNPVIFIEHKGKDITIISYSKTVLTALDAAKELEAKGINAEVLDLRSLVPLDFDAIAKSVTKTGRVLIPHEACEQTGYGAEIAAQIADKLFDELDAPIARVCGVNIHVPNATLPEIKSAPTVEKIVNAAVRLCQGGNR